MIAYLLETLPYGDHEIAAGDWPMPEFAGATIVATLELTASHDHGLGPVETAFVVGCEAAASVMVPILCAVWNRPVESLRHGVDYCAALPEDVGPYDGDGWADDPDTSAALYEWSDEMVNAAQDVGWIVESDADCGMTWFYRPMI